MFCSLLFKVQRGNQSEICITILSLAKRIPDIVLQAKASSTNKKYDEYFRKVDNWCATFGFTSLPALPNTLCIFLSHLVGKKVSSAVLES